MNNKKIVLLLVLIFILGFTPVIRAKEYKDVKEGEEFYEAIQYASDNNIVGGYSDGTFRAYEGVTRAEFTKMLINFKYTQEEIDGCKGNSFPDVAESYVHAKYICVAKKEGILNGYSDGSFKPEQKITTPEGIKIISNTYGYTEGNSDNFDKYFKVLENRSALPEASMWWPEEMWRGEVMEILYRLEESLTNREAITYSEYKEHQEWKEVVLEDAGIKFSVPSWFGMEEKDEYYMNGFFEGNFYNALFHHGGSSADFIEFSILPFSNTNNYYTKVSENNNYWKENVGFGQQCNAYYFDAELLINRNYIEYYYSTPSHNCPEIAYVYQNKNGGKYSIRNFLNRKYIEPSVIFPIGHEDEKKFNDNIKRAQTEFNNYQFVLETIVDSLELI